MAISPPTGSRTRLAIVVAASVTLVTLGLRDVPVIRDVREGAATVTDPIQSGVDAVTRPVRNAWHGVSDYEDLQDENERLRDQLEEAGAADISATDAQRQLADLSLVLDLPYANDIPKVVARVVSGPRSNFSHAVQIDKGSDDGLAVGMPVATGAGLAGRITQVSANSATVDLITDPEIRVGVRLASTGDLGTARGQGRGDPLVVDSSIGPRVQIAAGEGVVTSGVDRSVYPPGIPVGTVKTSRSGSGGLALELVVEPSVDFDRLSYLTVLQWQPG
ncbi:MAG TPA: rod shape-determining protein MreC [Acidimicrobiales bacterium]|nr:rod shape-determining protein MreC [Acidimicrobiales bacterium]